MICPRFGSDTHGNKNDGKMRSLGGVADDVVGEKVRPATHGQSDTVSVAVEGVISHGGLERLQHRHSGVAVVVDVVACCCKSKKTKTKLDGGNDDKD